MDWQAELALPALHGANFAPQVQSYFAPGFEPALLAGAAQGRFWHWLGYPYTDLYASI